MSWQRQARVLAISGLYQMDLSAKPLEKVIAEIKQGVSNKEDALYFAEAQNQEAVLRLFEQIIRGVYDKQVLLDKELSAHLDNWSLDRIGKIEKAILRLGSYELWQHQGHRREQILNEMIELTKVFCDPKAKDFVNAVLDAFSAENIF